MTLDDIAIANRLAHEVLGRSLDELPPQTRRLLVARRRDGATEDCERQQMERAATSASAAATCATYTGWGDTRCGCTSTGLSSWSTCSCTAAGAARASSTSCCSMGRAKTAGPCCPGLIDVERLARYSYDGKNVGPHRAQRGLQNGPNTGVSRGVPESSAQGPAERPFPAIPPKMHRNRLGAMIHDAS